MLEALRVRDFRLLWFARLISLLGSWLLVVAVPAQVYRLTGSLALTLAAEMVPPVLLGPVLGPAVVEASSIPWTAVAAGVLTVASGILAWVLLPRAVGHRSRG